MKEKLTPYLKKLSHKAGIARQYLTNPAGEAAANYNDPLLEDQHEVVKGLIHKYHNRALIKVSYLCAAHCRFCTRIRQIGNPEGTLQKEDVENIVDYISAHSEIDDVILSGGDPFLSPEITGLLIRKISKIQSVKVLRIGTRLALQSPKSMESHAVIKLLDSIRAISMEKAFYILLHVEHPDELTPEAVKALKIIKQRSETVLLSQTVFLKGINIDFDILHTLFTKLYHLSITPYYIYHCDTVKGLEAFAGDIETEKEIMRKLRDALSGIAFPVFVVDLEGGYGKYPIDLEILKNTNNRLYKR